MTENSFSIGTERVSGLRFSRRKFLQLCLFGLISLGFQNYFLKKALAELQVSGGRKKNRIKGDYDLVVAKGKDPYNLTIKAVDSMGGMARFVKKGSKVVIKPNMAWDRTPEHAATTNPMVVAALIDLCFKAGAKKINIFDIPCNEPKLCYEHSGIQRVAEERGANIYFPDDWNSVKASFSYESPLEGWPIFRDAIECDTFINVPVLKHHSLTGLTLSMKNLMGVCFGNRALIHLGIGKKLVDLTDFISPDLTVIDAYRVLVRHGPSGGDLEDVVAKNTVIVATDPTLADSFACKLMEKDPMTVPYINNAIKRNFGSSDVDNANILNLEA